MATSQLTSANPAQPRALRSSSILPASVATVLALSIAAYFWIDSRYPALTKKLHAGKSIHILGGLSFDALLPATPQMPLWTRIGNTAIDWAWTNRIGMTFGVFFGAAILTLLAYLPRRRFANAYSNTALGAVIGTPLGVCANCVAPIGRGLIQGGASRATTLATMISSPTLNIVVLTMAFTLLPLRIAILRLAAPLLLLAIVPLITRQRKSDPDCISAETCPVNLKPDAEWTESVPSVIRSYFVNLGKLALATVPWMLLAGLLGAIAIELIPAQSLPTQVSILGILVVAFLGTFAPVPIAFDVALAWILLSRGVPTPYVATLVCTLGAFSLYPLIIVGRSINWRVALELFAAVMTVGILAGAFTAIIG